MKERPRNITPMFRGLSPILLIHFLFFCSCNCLAGCFLFRIFIQNGECNIGCMVRDTLESGYKIGEDHAGFRRTFVAGQTLYMLLLQIPLLLINGIFNINDLLQVLHHIQHLGKIQFALFAEGHIVIRHLHSRICDILGMITNPLDIIDHMEQRSDAHNV